MGQLLGNMWATMRQSTLIVLLPSRLNAMVSELLLCKSQPFLS